jgi:predicted Fe-Mo cluster-binding NifX family protein
MKIAIAYWQGRVSPVFDVADRLLLLDTEGGREVHRESLRLVRSDPFGRAQELAELGVEMLLCGAVSLILEKAMIGAGIRVIAFLGGEVENVISVFLKGKLDDGRGRNANRIGKHSGFKSEKTKKPPAHEPGLRR